MMKEIIIGGVIMNSLKSAFGALIGCALLALSGNLAFTYEPLTRVFKDGVSSNELAIIFLILFGLAGGIYLVVQAIFNNEDAGISANQMPFLW